MEGITEIDIVILSYAQSEKLKCVTETCISSLRASEDPRKIKFNIVVVESAKELAPFQYRYTQTLYPEGEFGYNKFLNTGIEFTDSKYICLCHNDLTFNRGWATEMLKAFNRYYDLSSASPICSKHHPKMGFQLNNGDYCGYRNRYEVAGWCLFLKRDLFRIIGKLDENYKFWCADNDFANTLAASKLGHALVSSSIVDHMGEVTLNSRREEDEEEMSAKEFFYFEKKWNYRTDQMAWTEI